MTRFRLWGPGLRTVTLELDGFPPVRLASLGDGWFEDDLPVGAGTRYRYRMDNGASVVVAPDPASRQQDGDVHGWSVVVDAGAYVWQCSEWRGRPWEEAVIYEVHPGLLGGFRGIERRLPEIAALGITAIELMPIADFPGDRNWGYDGAMPYAPDAAYGTPDELRSMIDAAHRLGLMVLLDVVYNHFGPDGNYLGSCAPLAFREEIPTPWGACIDFRRPEVRSFFADSALQWIIDYRFDGLRFDAVHAINDASWLDEVALAVRAAVGDARHVHLVLEHDGNVASHLEREPHRFNAQWNDDGHHVLHVLLTGETRGYYGDYAEQPAEKLARALSEGFVYQGEPSAHRDGEARGTPSGHLPPTAFVLFLQNHDQTGNRPFGDRLTTLTPPAALKAAVALLLLTPQIPLIFMGEESGSETPFLYFTDHHDELADLVREGRRNEFAHFEEFADPAHRNRIPDPNDTATFLASVPADGPHAQAWREHYRQLLALRQAHLTPRLRGAQSLGARAVGERAVLAQWLLGDGARLTVLCNLGTAPVLLEGAYLDDAQFFPSHPLPRDAQSFQGPGTVAWLRPAPSVPAPAASEDDAPATPAPLHLHAR